LPDATVFPSCKKDFGFAAEQASGTRRGLMKNRFAMTVAAAVCFLLACLPSIAHHGNASFDSGKKVSLKATVTKWFWANPHCFLEFDVKDDAGNVVHWVAETSNPPDMINRGWSRQSFKPGDQVTVTLEPVKNGQPVGRVLEVLLANGQTLSINGPAPSAGKAKE
jgi:hypothetical protein